MAVEAYLLEHHVRHISWHIVLNNHASTRPKAHGGPIVPSIKACKTYQSHAPGNASADWRCTLHMPNSFAAGDGRRLVTDGDGSTKDEASEVACLRAVASLVSTSPSEFLFRPAHWDIPLDDLVAGLPGVGAGHQALPVHTPARSQDAGAEASEPDADARVVDLVRRCLQAHGGEFDPSAISHRKMGRLPGDERVYAEFNKLLQPGGLNTFIQHHPEFDSKPKGANGIIITWAHGGALQDVPPVAPGSASASGHLAPVAPGSASDWLGPEGPTHAEAVAADHSDTPTR